MIRVRVKVRVRVGVRVRELYSYSRLLGSIAMLGSIEKSYNHVVYAIRTSMQMKDLPFDHVVYAHRRSAMNCCDGYDDDYELY